MPLVKTKTQKMPPSLSVTAISKVPTQLLLIPNSKFDILPPNMQNTVVYTSSGVKQGNKCCKPKPWLSARFGFLDG
jgi:hypothetical protein